MSECKECGRSFSGRSDKKFCDEQCRSAYHNNIRRVEFKYVSQTNRILFRNRKVLYELFESGVNCLSLGELTELGFTHNYITSFRIMDGSISLSCYEFSISLDLDGTVHIRRYSPKRK